MLDGLPLSRYLSASWEFEYSVFRPFGVSVLVFSINPSDTSAVTNALGSAILYV